MTSNGNKIKERLVETFDNPLLKKKQNWQSSTEKKWQTSIRKKIKQQTSIGKKMTTFYW